MKKNEIAARLARQARVSPGAAADQLDRVVTEILKTLRKGENAKLPGLGTFLPGSKPTFRFDKKPGKGR